MGILDDIDSAAYDIIRGRVGDGFLPVAKNFNIAMSHNHPVIGSQFDVYSYTTRVAVVNKNENENGIRLFTVTLSTIPLLQADTCASSCRQWLAALIGTRFTRRATKLATMKLLTVMGDSLSM